MNHIIKSKALLLSALLMGSSAVFGQSEGQEMRGRVVDQQGNPVEGAVVNVAERSKIALTDKDGYFTLQNVNAYDEICAASVGYYSVIDTVKSLDNFQIVMLADSDKYMHTAPVPFGRKAKKLMTESTSVVSGEELQKHPITVLQNAFTQTVTGVETYEWSSEPGWTETAMYIRGIRTMNANARQPLIIVDNVERDLSFLDAFPIESITILKDAAAAAIYGMRGANGVVMVTTKRGEAGKTKIDFTQEVGFQLLSNKMEVQNSYNMARTRNQVRYLSGLDPLYTEEQIEKYRRVCNGEELEGIDKYKYFNTNWFDVLYRDKAPLVKTNLQISGGSARTRYYISFSYMHQGGMWNEEGTKWNENYNTQHRLNRYNLRSNIDVDVNKFLNVSLDLGGRIDDITQPTQSVFDLTTFGAVEANPMEPVYCPNGELYASSTARNPINFLAASGQEKNRRRNIYTTVSAQGDFGSIISILKGLKLRGAISFDSFETFESTQRNAINTYNYDYSNDAVTSVDDFKYKKYTTFSDLTNPSTNQREWYYHLNGNFGLYYDRVFADKHSVNAGAFLRTFKNTNNSSNSSVRNISLNGQLTYAYDNRYIVSGNVSYMGADNFFPDDRWDTFWGASAGWVASEESFLKDVDFLNLLKVRASYGKAGQSETGTNRYPYQSTYGSSGGYGYGHNATWVGGYKETLAGNANNKWEISEMINVGLDFDLFKEYNVYGQVDVFKEWRSNILVKRATMPALLGVAVANDSYGKAESKGMEVTLGHKGKIGPVGYHVEGRMTFNTNKIVEMDETEPDEPYQRKTGDRIRDYTEVAALYESSFNQTVGGWHQYEFVQWASDANLLATSKQDAVEHPEKYPFNENGVQQLGTAVFKDVNGDRVINEKDKKPAGYTIIPELIPSVDFGFEWNGFDVKANLTAYTRRSVFLSPAVSFSGWSNMGTHEVTKAWGYYTDDPTDPRNVNAKYSRPVYGGYNAIDSDRATGTYHNNIWIKDGKFLALRNVEFGYSLPKNLISRVGMTKARVYFQGYNLCNWSNLPKGLDPEKPMSYCWWYPKTKSFTVGLNLGF